MEKEVGCLFLEVELLLVCDLQIKVRRASSPSQDLIKAGRGLKNQGKGTCFAGRRLLESICSAFWVMQRSVEEAQLLCYL
jgi:hypothetical protein